jgi:hypothetical protein
MTANPYNEFTGAERMKAYRWWKRQEALGLVAKPTVCDLCEQTEGQIEGHSEDYSEPYGENIGRWGLCYRCHMMLHCRRKAPEAWARYARMICQGYQWPPTGRAWGRVTALLRGDAGAWEEARITNVNGRDPQLLRELAVISPTA